MQSVSDKGWSWASRNGLYRTGSWIKLRASILRKEPLCRMCKTMKEYRPATMVDHIVAVNELNWKELFLDESNLQPLCDSCHRFKTQRDKWHVNCSSISIEEILKL